MPEAVVWVLFCKPFHNLAQCLLEKAIIFARKSTCQLVRERQEFAVGKRAVSNLLYYALLETYGISDNQILSSHPPVVARERKKVVKRKERVDHRIRLKILTFPRAMIAYLGHRRIGCI